MNADNQTLQSLIQAGYLIAGVLFILSLAGLSHQRTPRPAMSPARSAC